MHLLLLFKIKNIYKNHSSSGFTLMEMLVVVLVIGIVSVIAAPNWLAFVNTRRLNTSQNEIHQAFRQAQSQAKKEKLTWNASFREYDGVVQWAVHPATVSPANANWNNLDANVLLDSETTLSLSDGIRQIQFDHTGSVKQPPLGRITLSSKYGGKAKRCIIVSTILGAIRTSQEQPTPQNNKYCY